MRHRPPTGAKRKFKYDDDNRLEKEEHFLPNTSTASKTMTYTYDQRGLLKSYDDGLTSGVYVYNDKGEKTSEAITFGRGANAFTKTITRTYEANGLSKSMTYPGSTGTLNFTYDNNNQLKTYKIPGLTTGVIRANAIESAKKFLILCRCPFSDLKSFLYF
jgi:hypothetical protein